MDDSFYVDIIAHPSDSELCVYIVRDSGGDECARYYGGESYNGVTAEAAAFADADWRNAD